MTIALWVVQILLAALFLMTGFMKTTRPIEFLAKQMEWVKHVPAWFVRFNGSLQFLGALGLILPAALHIAPVLTPLAGAGLAGIMVGAIIMHFRLNDAKGSLTPFILLVLALFVAIAGFPVYA